MKNEITAEFWAKYALNLKSLLKEVEVYLHNDNNIEAKALQQKVKDAISQAPSEYVQTYTNKTEIEKPLARTES